MLVEGQTSNIIQIRSSRMSREVLKSLWWGSIQRSGWMVLPFLFSSGKNNQSFLPVCCHLTAIVSFYIGFKWVIGPNSSTGLWGARQYKEPVNSELVKYSLCQGFREDFRKWNFWAVKYHSQFIVFSVICHSLKIYLQIRGWYLVGSTR